MHNSQITGPIITTLIIACMFMQIPLPKLIAPMRPDLITLILIYWWLAHPEKIGVIIGLIMGLILDVMYGALLGEHALGCVFIGWIVVKNYQSIRLLPLMQQTIIVGILLLIKQFLAYWIDNGRGYHTGSIFIYFSPVIIGALLWPWIFITMRNFRRKISRKF